MYTALIGPTELFIIEKYDQHVKAYKADVFFKEMDYDAARTSLRECADQIIKRIKK